MVRVAEVHLELQPDAILQNRHIPRARNRIRKLPDNVVTLFIGKSLKVGLDNRFAAFPNVRAERMEHVAAVFGVASLQVLKGINRLDGSQILMEPGDAA